MKFNVFSQLDKEAVKEYINRLSEGKSYTVEITLKKAKRSMDQNRLYWLWLNHIAKEGDFGYTAEELHQVFAQKFLGARQRVMYGEQVLNPPSTKKLSKEEFTAYLERIEVFSNTELGIQLPIPQDKFFEQIYEHYKDYI